MFNFAGVLTGKKILYSRIFDRLGDTYIKDYKHTDIDSEVAESDSPYVKLNKFLVKDIKYCNNVDVNDLDLFFPVPDASYYFSKLDEELGVEAMISVIVLILKTLF
jgi:hypothetical protein